MRLEKQRVNRQVRLQLRPIGIPQAEHFEIVEAPVPDILEGQVLVRNVYLSVDPAMRGWVNAAENYLDPVPLGSVMRSFAVGRVVDSKHPEYKTGDMVTGLFGWQDYAAIDGSSIDRKVIETDLPISTSLGILGMNGLTAYFGLFEIGRPVKGETVVVSAAAGVVGSCVGQIAKITGCRTVGITDGTRKKMLCLDEFGFDAAIDYKSEDVLTALVTACPDGLDIYFDTTSGSISDDVMHHLKARARVVVCGTISVPNWDPIPLGPRVERHLLVKRASMQGFLYSDYADRFAEGRQALARWVQEGLLRYREDVLVGIDQAPSAIAGLYRGENLGKRLIKIVEE
jgi:NADPH-dependent curcumin reductase CurA